MQTTTLGPHFDNPDFYAADPHAVFADLREHDPVHWYDEGEFWVVTRYEDIRHVSASPLVFSSRKAAILADLIAMKKGEMMGGSEGKGVMFMDPPEHAKHRKAIGGRFTPKAVTDLEADVRRSVVEVVDEMPDGAFDWIEHVAEVVPVRIFARLLGLPQEDWEKVAGWSTTIAATGSGDVTPDVIDFIMNEIGPYLLALIAERRDDPGDDLLSLLGQVGPDDEPFDDLTAMIYAITLLAAGSETTQSLIAGMAASLDEYPEQAERLFADPSLSGAVVEETLRWWTPVRSMARTAKVDVELGGSQIRAGQGLLLAYVSANRDQRKFGPTADEFDLLRPKASQHLAFGFGEHFCLGAHLARREARLLIDEIVSRFSGIEVVGEPVVRRSALMHTFDELPVRLTPR